MIKKYAYYFVALVIMSATLTTTKSHAQEGSILKLSPVSNKLNASPNETLTRSVMVQNTTNEPMRANVIFRDFTASSDKSGTPKILTGDEYNELYGLTKYISGAPTIYIPADSTVEYKYKVTAPNDSSPRTYFGTISFSDARYGGVGVSSSIASIVFLTVGVPDIAANIANVQLIKIPTPGKDKTIKASFEIENKGVGLLDVKPVVNIVTGSGSIIATLKPQSAGSVLPETSRLYEFTWTGDINSEESYYLSATAKVEGGDTLSSNKVDIYVPEIENESTKTADSRKENNLGLYIVAGSLIALVVTGLVFVKNRTKSRKIR